MTDKWIQFTAVLLQTNVWDKLIWTMTLSLEWRSWYGYMYIFAQLIQYIFWCRHSSVSLPHAFTICDWLFVVDIRRVCDSSVAVPSMPSLQRPGDSYTPLPVSWPTSQGKHKSFCFLKNTKLKEFKKKHGNDP